MAQRLPIPHRVEASLMFENDHTCCICREKGKDVQIHLIDGNGRNSDPGNLAVLCLDCHSKATGTRGLGRKYSETEIRKYKKDWEYRVRKKRGLIFVPHKDAKYR